MSLERHFLEDYDHAYITSFWGFKPEEWGCVSFHDEARRDRYIREETDPFVMAVYVTDDAAADSKSMRGKLAGFYELSLEPGLRNDLVSEEMREVEPGRWPYALKPLRAWRILPSFMPTMHDFIPEVYIRVRPVGRYGWRLPQSAFEKMKRLPVEQVDLWGQPPVAPGIGFMPKKPYRAETDDYTRSSLGWVQPGQYDLAGHFTEPQSPYKELYMLELTGPLDAVFGPMNGRRIIKVGLSTQPEDRLEAFNKAFPQSKLKWSLLHATSLDENDAYPHPKIAEAGETAMKRFLGASPKNHLGGEFYIASTENIEIAWLTGRKKAEEAQTEFGDLI